MDYQEKSNLKIGVSGVGKNYLKMPWSIEDTIENLEELKEMMQKKLIMTNYHERGEKDAEEIAFDFDRAIQALKEDQEYKQIGTLEEVREAVEKQNAQETRIMLGMYGIVYECKECGNELEMYCEYCPFCGQRQKWSDEE